MVDLPAPAAAPSPDHSLGDAFAWPMRDPEWLGKFALMGLISLIPIVGWLQLSGWMLTCLDNLRRGHQALPPADFRYASRGVYVFLVGLVWGLAAAVVVYGTLGAIFFGVFAANPTTHGQNGSPAFPLFFFPIWFATIALFSGVSLVLYAFVPVVIQFTDRTGFGGGFNVAGFVHALRTSPKETAAAGGVSLVAYFISGLGSYLCYVGIIFTIPYAMALLAGVLRWYEVNARPGALPTARA